MTFLGKFSFVLIGFCLAFGAYLYPSIVKLQEAEGRVELRIGNQFIVADLANTSQSRQRGLAGRNILGINEGMLFVFDEPGFHPIWMKGVNFPIDIIWINQGNRIVGLEEHVMPQPGVSDSELRVYFPPEPIQKVLELRAGRASLFDVGLGAEIRARPVLSPRFLEDFN